MINNKIESLTPRMQEKTKAFLKESRESGLDVFVFETLRSMNRQYELFGKSRTVEELKRYGVPTKYADPKARRATGTLNSNHFYGNAIDVVFDKNADPKIQVPTWSGDYGKLIEIGKKHGLRNLTPLETCHFEDDGTAIQSYTEEEKRLVLGNLKESNSRLWDEIEEAKKYITGGITMEYFVTLQESLSETNTYLRSRYY